MINLVSARPARLLRDRADRWKHRLRAISAERQFTIGVAIAGPPILLTLVPMRVDLPYPVHLLLLGLAALGCVAARPLMTPWFETLSRTEQRRITALPMTGYIGLGILFIVCTLLLATSGRGASAALLIAVWIYHSLYGAEMEPSSSAYGRLRGRLGRAAPMRLTANWAGIGGVLLALSYLWDRPEFRAAVIGATCTIVLAGLGASVRILVRVRRLRTSLHRSAEDLELKLETLHAVGPDHDDQRQAAKAAWGELRRVLDNKIDTGVSFSGVGVLPREMVRELHHEVHRVVGAAGVEQREYRRVLARLRMMRMACIRRTDTLA